MRSKHLLALGFGIGLVAVVCLAVPPSHAQESKIKSSTAKERTQIGPTLADDLENYLKENKDNLSPRVHADLHKILVKHRQPGRENKPEPSAKAKITKPRSGQRVGSRIPVTVQGDNVASGSHYWIMVERQGLVWPKEPEVKLVDGKWSGIAHEGGSPGNLTLTLISVGEKSHKQILTWFKTSQSTGKYPGLTLKSLGAKRIDTVKDLDYK